MITGDKRVRNVDLSSQSIQSSKSQGPINRELECRMIGEEHGGAECLLKEHEGHQRTPLRENDVWAEN